MCLILISLFINSVKHDYNEQLGTARVFVISEFVIIEFFCYYYADTLQYNIRQKRKPEME